LKMNNLHKTLFKKRAKSAVKLKKNIFLIAKKSLAFLRCCDTL